MDERIVTNIAEIQEKEAPMPDPAPAEPVPRLPDALAWTGFFLILLGYLIIKSYSFHWEVGDENIYLYMARATADHGLWFYRDFFFAHPPLHLLPGILLAKIATTTPFTARLIPVVATVAGALFLFLLAHKRTGRLSAVAAAALYLCSFDVLRASSHWTGINLSVMWLCAGLWALGTHRVSLAGVFMALGVGTGNYVLPSAMTAMALCFLRSWRHGARFAVGFIIPWAAVQAFGLVLGGGAYLDAVYRYHLAKPGAAGGTGGMFARVLTDNFALIVTACSALVLVLLQGWLNRRLQEPPPDEPSPEEAGGLRRAARMVRDLLDLEGRRGWVLALGAFALANLLFLSLLSRLFPFYFLLLFVFLALMGGYAVQDFFERLRALWRARRRRERSFYEAGAILSLLLIAAVAAALVRLPLQRTLLPNYVRTADRPMVWADAPVPDFVNRLARFLCFEDTAVAWRDYGTCTEALFHESQYFESAETLADYVRQNTHPAQTIFGDSSSAGLIALLSGRRLAADEADTNVMRFRSRTTSIRDFLQRVDTPHLAMVVVSGRELQGKNGRVERRFDGFASLPEFRRFIEENFTPAFKVHDRTKGDFFIYRRN
jgi:hypothetical protein